MKRLILSTLSAAIGLSVAAPAFAYILKHEEIKAQTSPYHTGRPSRRDITHRFGRLNNSPTGTSGVYNSVRTAPGADNSGRVLLQRAEGRRYRRLNRMPQQGDSYRMLNTHPNKRSINRANQQSFLPSSLVQTGPDLDYSRVSRRTIRGNRDLFLLTEIANSTR